MTKKCRSKIEYILTGIFIAIGFYIASIVLALVVFIGAFILVGIDMLFNFNGMKQRCYNQKLKEYKYYGAIGIIVCDEWLNSYESFCIWADKTGYKKGMTIDRIDVNKGYSPDNCRWITQKEQQENRHIQRNNTSGFCGVSFQKNTKKWFSYIWNNKKRINCGYFNTAKEANNARNIKLEELKLNYKRTNYE